MDLRLPGVPPGELVSLHQQGVLSPSEYQTAVEWATQPPPRPRWAAYLRDWFLIFGIVCLVSGVIMFGAYNWQALHRFAKLGILQLLLLAAWLGSRLRGLHSKEGTALLWGASVLVGALLAVYGQIYQTGADAYNLFLAWSLLILPWCLAGRSNLIWFSEAVLANLTFVLAWDQLVGTELETFAPVYLLFNLCLAALWEIGRRSRPWMDMALTDSLLAAALTPVTVAASVVFWEEEYWLCVPAVLLTLGLLYAGYRQQVRKMALVAASLVTILSGWWFRLVANDGFGFLLVALGIVAEVTLAARWLQAIHSRAARAGLAGQTPSAPVKSASVMVPPATETTTEVPTEAVAAVGSEALEPTPAASTPRHRRTPGQDEPGTLELLARQGLLEESPPWQLRQREREVPRYVGCLTAMGAWMAAWFFLLFIFTAVLQSEFAAVVLGLLLFVGSILARRTVSASSDFAIQALFAVNLASQILMVLGLAEIGSWQPESMSAYMLLLQLAGLIWYQDRIARTLFAFGSVVTGGFLLQELAQRTGLSAWLVLVAVLLSSLLSNQRSWLLSRWRDLYGPISFGWCAGLLATVALWGFSDSLGWAYFPGLSGLATVGLTLVSCFTALRLQAPVSAVVVLALLGAVTFTVPGLMAGVLVFILAYHARSQANMTLAILALLGYGIQYYYTLELDFLGKSACLIGSGLLLLVARSGLRSREVSNAF
jgi:hypothetical protein